MSDVFISYARADIARVRVLHAELKALGREVWVDWEGIPPTAEWMREIRAAIDAAQAFAFVLSPDSLASRVCGLELEHAVARGKRLIPIVVRTFDATQVPETLGRLNWIYARPEDAIDESAQRLIAAIETDLAHVEQHTRLLLRAVEWELRGNDEGLALRGRPLASAEAWLAEAALKEPAPTALHTRFVLQSRATANRRRVRLLGGFGLAAAALVGVSVAAWFENRNGARQETLAIASRLASESELARNARGDRNDIDLQDRALLLAAESARTLQAAGLRALQSDLALRRALALRPQRVQRWHADHDVGAGALAVAADGSVLALHPRVGLTRFAAGEAPARVGAPPQQPVESVRFNASARLALLIRAGGAPGRVDLHDTRSFERVRSVEREGCRAHDAQADDAGTLLLMSCSAAASSSGDTATHVFHLEGGRMREGARLPGNTVFVVDPAGSWVAASVDGLLRVWRVERKPLPMLVEVVLSWSWPSQHNLAVSPDGAYLLTQAFGESFTLHTSDWSSASDSRAAIGLAVSGRGRWMAGLSNTGGDTLVVVDLAEQREAARLAFNLTGGVFAFDKGGTLLAVFDNRGNDRNVDLWRLDTGDSDLGTVGIDEPIVRIAFRPDESGVLTAGVSSLGTWPLAPGKPIKGQAGGVGILTAFDPDGHTLARLEGGEIVVRDTADGRLLRRMRFEGRAVALAVANQGRDVAVALADTGILVWTGDDKRPPRRLDTPEPVDPRWLAAHPGGVVLAAWPERRATRSGQAWQVLYAEGAADAAPQLLDVTVNRSGLRAPPCAFSADGRRFASQSGAGVVVREVPGGAVVATVDHRSSSTRCAFSRDGSLLAVSNGDTVRVWSLEGPVEIARIEEAGAIDAMTFSPTARYLATHAGSRFRVWVLQPGALADHACRRLETNLEAETWRAVHGKRPYRPTCAGLPTPTP